jgi:hypothetical protein
MGNYSQTGEESQRAFVAAPHNAGRHPLNFMGFFYESYEALGAEKPGQAASR